MFSHGIVRVAPRTGGPGDDDVFIAHGPHDGTAVILTVPDLCRHRETVCLGCAPEWEKEYRIDWRGPDPSNPDTFADAPITTPDLLSATIAVTDRRARERVRCRFEPSGRECPNLAVVEVTFPRWPELPAVPTCAECLPCWNDDVAATARPVGSPAPVTIPARDRVVSGCVCGEPVRAARPTDTAYRFGGRLAHTDGQPLCPVGTDTGYRPADHPDATTDAPTDAPTDADPRGHRR